MEKLNLTAEQILNNEFQTDFKGYSPAEVDSFLDLIMEDYQIMEENVDELLSIINNLQEEVKALNAENIELKGKQKAIDLSQTTRYSSVDILKRVSRLEEALLGK